MAKKAAVKEAVAAVAPQVVVVDAPQVVQIPVEVVILDPVVVPPNALLAAQLAELEVHRANVEAAKVQLATDKLGLEKDLLVLELAKTASERRRVLAEAFEQQRSHGGPTRTVNHGTPPPRGNPALPFGGQSAGGADSSDVGRRTTERRSPRYEEDDFTQPAHKSYDASDTRKRERERSGGSDHGDHGGRREEREREGFDHGSSRKRRSNSDRSRHRDDDDLSEDDEQGNSGSERDTSSRKVYHSLTKDEERIANALFRASKVNAEDFEVLCEELRAGDGGGIFVAHQAAVLLQALVSCIGVFDELTDQDSGSVARRLPGGAAVGGSAKANASTSELAAMELAKFLMSLGPKRVILRILKLSTQSMDLAAFDPKNRDAFGGLDAIMPQKKREALAKPSGSGLALIQQLTKLTIITVASDAQFAVALGAVILIALDLLSQGVNPAVVAEYVWLCRVEAKNGTAGLRPESLKCFFSLDQTMFLKAGGRVKANGEVLGDVTVESIFTPPTPASSSGGNRQVGVSQSSDRDRRREQPRSWPRFGVSNPRAGQRGTSDLPFASSTCDRFNQKGGCSRHQCSWRHACSACDKNHSLANCVESRPPPRPMLAITEGTPVAKRVGFP